MTRVNVSESGRIFTRVIKTYSRNGEVQQQRIPVAELNGVRVYCVPSTGEIIVTEENLYAFDVTGENS